MLIWADSLSNKYENRRGSLFGADARRKKTTTKNECLVKVNTDTRQTEHSFTDPDSEMKQYQHSFTKYHNPHCTAYAYSDTQLGFLTMLVTLTVVLSI